MDKQVDEKQVDRRTGRDHRRHDRNSGRPATSAQVRDEMPSGRTIGRSSARDPAAAPMDADDEAAGHPPGEGAIAHERIALRHDGLPDTGLPREFGLDEPDYLSDPAARGQALVTAIVVGVMVLGCVALWFAM